MWFIARIGFLIICLTSSIAVAEDTGSLAAEGGGFARVVPPQPTQDKQRVEVIEFFWYGCPHCYNFEPHLNEWAKNLPDNVQFIRQPAIFSAKWAAGAKAYFVADVLGVTDKVHGDLFAVIQEQKKSLDSEEEMVEFFVAHGVDKEAFHNAYNSFYVATKMSQAENMPMRYGVTGVPAVIVNGKYRTNGTLAKTFPNMLDVMNRLIAVESSGNQSQSSE